MTVTVKKIGGSICVLIPKAVAREMELAEGTSLAISTHRGAMVMRKAAQRRKRRPLKEIVAQIKPSSYRRRARELAGDGPVGREVW
jgi:antitoxin component of MazEF toxin-antitoxin module